MRRPFLGEPPRWFFIWRDMMAKELDRTIFETSRASEYFNARELQAQTGQSANNFVTVAFKELMDNALDACETTRVAPRISVEVKEEPGQITFSVTDNGPGIDSATVEKILNFNTSTSDKTAYRSPTRGAQGNALKTVLGMPHALGHRSPIEITALGRKHIIDIWSDPAGEVWLDHNVKRVRRFPGTRILVTFPTHYGNYGDEHQEYDLVQWTRGFALFNPHASFGINTNSVGFDEEVYLAKDDLPKISDSYKSTIEFPDSSWRKYLPTDLTSPHWYETSDLERLIFSHIGESKKGGKDLTLREFVTQFKGLSGSAKSKKVCDRLKAIQRLSDFEENQRAVGKLLQYMKDEVKPPSPNTLGLVGKDHFAECFADWFGVQEIDYKKIARSLNGVPWVFEVAIARDNPDDFEDIEEPLFFSGINFSPTYEDPFAGTSLACHEYSVMGVKSFLSQAHCSSKPVAVHMIFPF